MGRSERAGVVTAETDRSALSAYIRRQYPTSEMLDASLTALEREPAVEKRLLLQAAGALMDADGVQDPAEREMLNRLRQQMG